MPLNNTFRTEKSSYQSLGDEETTREEGEDLKILSLSSTGASSTPARAQPFMAHWADMSLLATLWM